MRIRETQNGRTVYSHKSVKSSTATYSVEMASKGGGGMMFGTLQLMPPGHTFISILID